MPKRAVLSGIFEAIKNIEPQNREKSSILASHAKSRFNLSKYVAILCTFAIEMSKEEYIKLCAVSSAKELSDEQILHYFLLRNGGFRNMLSASEIMQGRVFGMELDRTKSIALLRQAFEEDKVLEIHFIEGEGVVFEGKKIGGPRFEMFLTDKRAFDYK